MTPPTPSPDGSPADGLPEDHAPEVDDLWSAEHRTRTTRAQGDLRRDHAQDPAKVSDGRGARQASRTIVLPVSDLARDLVAAGFSLHDCNTPASTGGVCLTPLTPHPGVAVSWTTHDALRSSFHSCAETRRIHDVMNTAVADVLVVMGWPVVPHGDGGAPCVTGPPHQAPSTATLFDPGDEE